jgi:hypothetical protein
MANLDNGAMLQGVRVCGADAQQNPLPFIVHDVGHSTVDARHQRPRSIDLLSVSI